MIPTLKAVSLSLLMSATSALAGTVGQPAPDFALTDVSGKAVKLADFRGKHVVLEWVNPGCPYVAKHYDSANMQGLQKEYTGRNVAWLAINSTRKDHGDYLSPGDMAGWMKKTGGAPTATLMDTDGKVGRAYGARTTPHMYVIDPKGQLVYAGAIDDRRSTNPADVKTAKNYVRAAMSEALAGKPVSTATTTAYGCTVKY